MWNIHQVIYDSVVPTTYCHNNFIYDFNLKHYWKFLKMYKFQSSSYLKLEIERPSIIEEVLYLEVLK